MAFSFTNKLVLKPFDSFGALKTACKFIAITEMFLPVMFVLHLVLENHGLCLCNSAAGVFPSPQENIFWPIVTNDNTLFGYQFSFDISFALSLILIICCAVKFGMGLKLYLRVFQEDEKFCGFWFIVNSFTSATGAIFMTHKIPYYQNDWILAGSDFSLLLYQLLSLWMVHAFLIALRKRNDDKGKDKEDNNKEKVGNNNISSSSKKIEVYVV